MKVERANSVSISFPIEMGDFLATVTTPARLATTVVRGSGPNQSLVDQPIYVLLRASLDARPDHPQVYAGYV